MLDGCTDWNVPAPSSPLHPQALTHFESDCNTPTSAASLPVYVFIPPPPPVLYPRLCLCSLLSAGDVFLKVWVSDAQLTCIGLAS